MITAILLSAALAAGGQALPAASATATCTFSNPSYSGECVESAPVAEGSTAMETCQGILECLNDTGCLKTYCQATEIRSGWRLVSAK